MPVHAQPVGSIKPHQPPLPDAAAARAGGVREIPLLGGVVVVVGIDVDVAPIAVALDEAVAGEGELHTRRKPRVDS